ncbi:hypothetical protein HGRIS_003137 [Hohenbuehelia grisea]|uniref:Cytochrome P450 n=1 Tax=Hohenbuehelia grisea TaxID=104357 RepID=A0ABR3JNF8_9AGAR
MWIQYTDLAEVYGPVLHLTTLGKHTVVLNSVKAAHELLEKRSRLYSDRPQNPMTEL